VEAEPAPGTEGDVQSKAKTVDGYLAQLPAERRKVVALLRGLIRKSVPTAREDMQYGMPCYSLGATLCAVAAQKGHYSVYVHDAKAVERFRSQLGKLSVGKGCIRFRKTEEVPLDVLSKILSTAASRRTSGETTKACEDD
jgi:uncharacterized protein YdhG (YjbR/CyaY superfamily)